MTGELILHVNYRNTKKKASVKNVRHSKEKRKPVPTTVIGVLDGPEGLIILHDGDDNCV
jgi:hypothetical protein